MSNLRHYIIRETIIFDDDTHPSTSPFDIVWPVSVLDAIIDQNTPERMTLRQILDQLVKRLDEGQEELKLEYPVRSVRGERYQDDPLRPEFLGDVIITKKGLDLENVDNVADQLKPISVYQQNWVETYVAQQLAELPPADLSSLSAHLGNLSNPHRVTLNQINVGGKDGIVTDLIGAMLDAHDKSGSSHNDIRNLVENLQSIVDSNNVNIHHFTNDLAKDLIEHTNIGGQHHVQLFDSKDDKLNKVGFFSSPYVNAPGVSITDLDDLHYPSTLAVANYVEARLVRPVNSSIGGGGGIGGSSDIKNITVRSDDRSLPTPSAANLGQAYLVTELKDSPGWAGLVVCRKMGTQYQWSIDRYIPIAKMDPAYFEEGPDGWKFKPQTSTVDTLTDVELNLQYVSDRLTGDKYYAFNEILHGSRFIGGTEHREVFKFGELATKNTLSGNEIVSNSITGAHLQPKTIIADNIADGTITSEKIAYFSLNSDVLGDECLRARHLPMSGTPEGTELSHIIENQHLYDQSINYTKLKDYIIPNEKLTRVPGQTLKGRLSLDTGKLEDIPIRSVALTLAEMVGSMIRINMVGTWPTSITDYPNGSLVYNSSMNAVGVRVSGTTWRYLSMSGTDQVTPTN